MNITEELTKKSERLIALQEALRNGDSVIVEELWNASKALIVGLAQQATGKHILLLTGSGQEEARLFHDFPTFSDRPVIEFPAWEALPGDNLTPSPDIVGDRYRALKDISSSNQPHIILTSLQACLQRVLPPPSFKKLFLTIQLGDLQSTEMLSEQLTSMGYRRQPIASDKGEFAIRGGIVDIFPVSTPDPYRIELFGDEVESIRTFDPVGQKSVQKVSSVDIPPAQEVEFIQQSETTSTLLDYLGNNTLVVMDDLLSLEDRYASLVSMGGSASNSFCTIDQLLDQLKPLQALFWSQQPIEQLSEIKLLDKQQGSYYSQQAPLYRMSFQIFNRTFTARHWNNPFISISDFLLPEIPEGQQVSGDQIFEALRKLQNREEELLILCNTESEEISFHNRIDQAGIILPKSTIFKIGYLSTGLVLPDAKAIILPTTEVTHRFRIRRQKQRSTYHAVETGFHEMGSGEMVVHLNHGIGQFLGLEERPDHNGVMTEFFQLEYADKAKLYVPIHQAHLLTKYIGATEETPKLHTLGNSKWKRTKEKTESAIQTYAKDLLQLYAQRAASKGFAYPEDSPDMLSFEEDFPFVETEDQLAAIGAVKKDMQSELSMDRLVCGDVGYGKTEVAMRAAFKAVLDGRKQVAVLVPTTVLALQHYETFCDRMANFPINIGVLSRFRTAKEIKETLAGAEKGTVDIIIGTHRIISKDVKFKDLGLIIIDEEQRFGVKAKEHLKKLKVNVDCLTLSATPIPRTLYMSLVGARDMSVINTPPQDRLPITTVLTEPNENLIRNALLRELARDGQAFVIHNRVETIYETADNIKRLLPQARIVVGHGQMHADELDMVFHQFKSGAADILVATSIVENGIDIPNANTILIEKADHFGMADLYQLRGRVGRWNRKAYAYFLVRNMHRLPEISRKRLQALAESSGHGGGMKVAMRDLEIRGAGNILGTEQSGHVAAIGFHLYCKMLKRAVKSMQGEIPREVTDTKMEFKIDARLPDAYVNEVSLRMEFYQRFGEALSFDEVDGIFEELQDRFGPPPDPVRWLYHLMRIRVFASLNAFSVIKIEDLSLTAERRLGQHVNTKHAYLGKIKDPFDLEAKVVQNLKQAFAL